jgi:HAMP domain-containing protein
MLRKFESILRNLKLGKKFNILLLLVFIGGISLSGVAFAAILNQNAENEVSSKALILLKTMNSVRDYTSTQVNPELAPRLESEFLPETVPAYSAREVFENLRKDQDYNEFFYKEATLNPTNLRDKADSFETEIVERFQKQPNTKELRGSLASPSGDLFYIARPIIISKPSCLECHSTPEVAPKSLIERYGTENGFNWKLNDIVGAQIISVPAHDIVNSARQSFFLLMGIVFIIFAVAIITVNLLLNRYVIQPLNRMARVAEEVSTGNMEAEFGQMSNDEVGSLAAAFTRMKLSLAMAMNMLNQARRGRTRAKDSGSSSREDTPRN